MQIKHSHICQSNQLSFKQPLHRTIWWLIIEDLRLCCFLILTPTLSASVCLSPPLSLSPYSFPKIRHRLQHESCRPLFWVCHKWCCRSLLGHPLSPSLSRHVSTSHLPTRSVAMAPARSPQGPSYLHSSACSTPVSILSNPASCQRKAGVRPLAV